MVKKIVLFAYELNSCLFDNRKCDIKGRYYLERGQPNANVLPIQLSLVFVWPSDLQWNPIAFTVYGSGGIVFVSQLR